MYIIHHLKHVRKCIKSRNFFMDIIFDSYSSSLKRLEFFADFCRLVPPVYRSFRNLRGTKAYKLILFALENHLRIIRPCSTSGHGRFTHNLDYTDLVCAILDSIGVSYILLNDAPRGGKCGNYIQLYLTDYDK